MNLSVIFFNYLTKCERNYQCTEYYLNGLDINLHKYLSCHVYIEDDRITFISLYLKKIKVTFWKKVSMNLHIKLYQVIY